jgi:hypothetical protein
VLYVEPTTVHLLHNPDSFHATRNVQRRSHSSVTPDYFEPAKSSLCGLVTRDPGYRSRGPVRFPALPDFLRSSGSGTGSTQPREYN